MAGTGVAWLLVAGCLLGVTYVCHSLAVMCAEAFCVTDSVPNSHLSQAHRHRCIVPLLA